MSFIMIILAVMKYINIEDKQPEDSRLLSILLSKEDGTGSCTILGRWYKGSFLLGEEQANYDHFISNGYTKVFWHALPYNPVKLKI